MSVKLGLLGFLQDPNRPKLQNLSLLPKTIRSLFPKVLARGTTQLAYSPKIAAALASFSPTGSRHYFVESPTTIRFALLCSETSLIRKDSDLWDPCNSPRTPSFSSNREYKIHKIPVHHTTSSCERLPQVQGRIRPPPLQYLSF